jgi:hypothetical protein
LIFDTLLFLSVPYRIRSSDDKYDKKSMFR